MFEYGTIEYLRACLHGDGGPQIGEVTCQQALKQFLLNETRCIKKKMRTRLSIYWHKSIVHIEYHSIG